MVSMVEGPVDFKLFVHDFSKTGYNYIGYFCLELLYICWPLVIAAFWHMEARTLFTKCASWAIMNDQLFEIGDLVLTNNKANVGATLLQNAIVALSTWYYFKRYRHANIGANKD